MCTNPGKLCIVHKDPVIRWKQRFQNFSKALALLRQALEHGPSRLSLLEKEGVIQRFEYSFELAWKTLKDFLEEGGLVISPVTPREVLKDAFAAKVLADGQVWIDMLDHRNLLAHNYDGVVLVEVTDALAARYFPAMEQLRDFLAAPAPEAIQPSVG